MEIGLNVVAAYVLNLVTIVFVYHVLFQFCRVLYRRNLVLFVAFLIFVSPFAYVLASVKSLAELLWVLSFSPFFGVAVMMFLFTSWMIRFYSIAFGVLAVVHYFFVRRSLNGDFSVDRSRFEFFYDQAGKVRARAVAGDGVGVAKRRLNLARAFGKYWNFALVFVLVVLLLSTFSVGGVSGPRNPTYQEALGFVSSDKTELRPYDRSWACVAFAREFQSNARKAGFYCGFVVVYFPDGNSHALDAFNTTDSGLMFVEPQSDEVVSLSIGEPYWNRAKYSPPRYDDTVEGFLVEW